MGSLLFLSKVLMRPEMLGVLVMIVSVAINTAIQQIFSPYYVTLMRDNDTAMFGLITDYDTNPPADIGSTTATFPDSSLTGAFSCQSSRCEWLSEYYTAGFAAKCEDVTAATIPNGNYSFNNRTAEHHHNITTPGGIDLILTPLQTMILPAVKIGTLDLADYCKPLGSSAKATSDVIRIAEYRLRGPYHSAFSNGFFNETTTPDLEWNTATECNFSVAVHSLSNVVAEGSNIIIGSREIIPKARTTTSGSPKAAHEGFDP